MEFRAIAGLFLYIFHRSRVPEADGITDEDTAARQLRLSGGIGCHAPCCSAVLRDTESADCLVSTFDNSFWLFTN